MRDPGKVVEDNEVYWHTPGEIAPCGFTMDEATRETCGAPGEYVFGLVGWRPNDKGSACAKHAALLRAYQPVAWMRSEL